MKQKVYFRADASQEIGYGHFIRSLALADMLKEDFDCTFFTQTPSDYQVKEVLNVCSLVELPSYESKFDRFLEYLTGDEIVVLDNYFFSTDYQRAIKKKGCILICIDDMHDKHYVADVVINHGCSERSYFDIEPNTRLCLGARWTLLRKPFIENMNASKKQKDSWFISFGGSDSNNLTEKYIKVLINKDISDIEVVIGNSYQYIESLTKYPSVNVYRNLSASQMASLMNVCENAILPTSGICLEALSQGCNVYAGYCIDNQLCMYGYLVGVQAIHPMGDLRITDDIEMSPRNKNGNSLHTEMKNIGLRYNLLVRSLDNNSVVINGLTFIDYTRLPLDKHEEVWQIRNEWDIRKHMDSTNIIPWENHCRFIESLIDNTSKTYWAVYQDDEFLASVNITYLSDNVVERGIFISPSQFGKSVGSKIECAMFELLKSMSIVAVEAKVLHGNAVSLAFHDKNEYKKYHEDDKYCYLRRIIKNE